MSRIRIWLPEEDEDGIKARIVALAEQGKLLEALCTTYGVRDLDLIPIYWHYDKGNPSLCAFIHDCNEALDRSQLRAFETDIYRNTGVMVCAQQESDDELEVRVGRVNGRLIYPSEK